VASRDADRFRVRYRLSLDIAVTPWLRIPEALEQSFRNDLNARSEKHLSADSEVKSVFFNYDASGQRVRKVWEHGTVEERIYLGGFEIYRKRLTLSGAVDLERETLHVMDDRIPIRSTRMCRRFRACCVSSSYWPNVGFGRFGKKVTLENSPTFAVMDEFDARRVRFGDIDGSGTSDIFTWAREASPSTSINPATRSRRRRFTRCRLSTTSLR
jgi:hypothetical protein